MTLPIDAGFNTHTSRKGLRMLYMITEKGLKVLVVNSQNLEKLKEGRPLMTMDGSVFVAWTPDLQWVADQVQEYAKTCEGALPLGSIIEASLSRPEKPFTPTKNRVHEFLSKDGGQNPPEFGG